MSHGLAVASLAVAALCALVAGVFFAFSSFVMAGLQRLPAAQGLAAMQRINETAVTPPFMLALFLPAAACLALGIWAIRSSGTPAAPWVLAGCAIYLVGVIGLTIAWHVPLNDTLAAVDPASAEASREWTRYLDRWVPLNHVRALAGLASAALLVVGTRV